MQNEFEAPLKFAAQIVPAEWIDFNGHMNVAHYVSAFDHCVDDMFNRLGIGPAQMEETHCSAFTLELHISYLSEVVEGDPLQVTGRLLDYDEKRFHAYFEMFHAVEDRMVAAMEQIGIHIDMRTRRSAPFSGESMGRFERMMASHGRLPEPRYAGRVIGIPRK
ncbi:MAG: thioesterase family protein [Arenicellales bacterium]